MTDLITPRALFCPIFLQSCSHIHERGQITHSRDIFIQKFWRFCGRLLDLVQPEVDQFDPPTQKPYPGSGTKHEVNRMIGCGDIADFSLRVRIATIFYFRQTFW